MPATRIIDINGLELFSVSNPGNVQLTGSNAKVDGAAAPIIPQMKYNGVTYDLERNNTQSILLASAARTATVLGSNQTNYNARGIFVLLDITVASGLGGLQVRIQGIDPVTGNNVSLNGAPTAIIATGTYGYEFYPGSSTAAVAGNNNVNGRYATTLPRTWRLVVVHGDGSSYTYSVGYSLIL